MFIQTDVLRQFSVQDLLMYMDPSLQHRREFSEQVNNWNAQKDKIRGEISVKTKCIRTGEWWNAQKEKMRGKVSI